MSDLVGNPEDRFSHKEAHIILFYLHLFQVNKTMMLSPGRVTVQTASCMERKRTKDLQRHKTMPYKKRRIELKKERSETAVAHETREGPTYSSSIDCSIQENPAVDLTKIPDPYPVPVPAKLPSNNTKYNLVYFDLETTGLGKYSLNEPRHEKTGFLAYVKTRPQISCGVTAQLISIFVFATQIVQSLFFLNLKFQASSSHLWL